MFLSQTANLGYNNKAAIFYILSPISMINILIFYTLSGIKSRYSGIIIPEKV